MELTRRTFVKTTAVALASAAAAGTMGGCSSSLAGTGGDAAALGRRLREDRGRLPLLRLRLRRHRGGQGRQGDLGRRAIRRMVSSRGLNCVKGYYLAGALYGEDRLTTPAHPRR